MVSVFRNRPVNWLLARAFTSALEGHVSDLTRPHSSLFGGHRAILFLRSDFSAVFNPSSHDQHWWDLGLKSSNFSRHFSSGGEPAHERITMPALSPTMTQGNVIKWKKDEGDKVAVGDVLCEIETDKATLDLEAMEDGSFVGFPPTRYLAKIIAPAGAKDIAVGQPLCIVVEEEGDVGKFGSFTGAESTDASSDVESNSENKPSNGSTSPDVACQNITMPALSPTMTQGNLLNWEKNEGEKVTVGDVLCKIETDKATLDLEAMEDGYMAKILVQGGTKDIPVGQSLCLVVEEESDVEKFKNYPGAPAAAKSKKASTGAEIKISEARHTRSGSLPDTGPKRNRVGPSVRRYLAESGLDASSLEGTGPHGMLLKGDVLMAMQSGPPKSGETAVQSTPSAKSDISTPTKMVASESSEVFYHDIPNSQIRKIIAKRLLESKTQIPHIYLSADAILDPTLELRKDLKEKHGSSVSVNDFVVRAAALALREVPEANAFWDEKSGEIVLNKSIDISVAVATNKGLMTPIVKDADQKSLSAISSVVKSLAERARAGKLKPSEFQGGTFSISNLGMFSVDCFSAIINPPQACILAVGRGEKHVEWAKNGDFPVTVTKMGLTLSADHRVFDGGVGSRFLKALITNLADPKNMLL